MTKKFDKITMEELLEPEDYKIILKIKNGDPNYPKTFVELCRLFNNYVRKEKLERLASIQNDQHTKSTNIQKE